MLRPHKYPACTSIKLVVSMFALTSSLPALANSVKWDGQLSVLKCDRIGNGMEFTLNTGQKVPGSQVDSVCTCITNKTNKSGWELVTFEKLARGEKVGFIKRNGAIARFSQGVKACTEGKFY